MFDAQLRDGQIIIIYIEDLSELAKQEDLIWGGDFKQRWDPCHIEMP